MFKEFKAFVMRGNVVDLAVAVVVGAAFGAVVTSLIENLITPLVGIPGQTNFASLKFTINESVFRYGLFLNSLISFLSISAAAFFFVVKPINLLAQRRKRGQEEEPPEMTTQEVLLSEIRDLLRAQQAR